VINNHHPPKVFERIVGWLAPHALEEDLLGDLEEDFNNLCKHSHVKARLGYIDNTLKLIPFLLFVRLREASAPTMLPQLSMVTVFLCVLVAWELMLVQKHAWPITARFIGISFMPAKGLYFGIYSALYLLVVAAIYCLNLTAIWRQKAIYLHPNVLAIILTVMPLFGIFYPQPLDSYLMRALHILVIWVVANIIVVKNSASHT